MKGEIGQTKDDAEGFKGELDDVSPDEITPTGDDDFDSMGGEDEGTEPLGEDEKDKAKQIKTPEDAKKALEEAKKDISDVVEHLDGLLGQTEGEEKQASLKRMSSKYASDLISFSNLVDKAITDAKSAMRHWSFLLKIKRTKVSSIKDPNLKKAAQQIEDLGKLSKFVQKVFGGKQTKATAVPPDRSDFSGDKWPDKGNPALVENRAWEAGASKFDRDVKFEDARPNPAVDERLTDVDYHNDDKPFVNSALIRFVPVRENKYASYWDIFDGKTGKRAQAVFANLPTSIAERKDEKNFGLFSSKEYGNQIKSHVMTRGIVRVAKELNAIPAKVTTAFLKTAAEDKSTLKSYYTDAFGSSEYAGELTSGGGKEDMEIGYKPQDEHPKDKKEETKDGPGKISKRIAKLQRKLAKSNAKLRNFTKTASQVKDVDGVLLVDKVRARIAKLNDKIAKLSTELKAQYPNYVPAVKAGSVSSADKALIKARADRAVAVARKFASRGAIPFNQKAIYAKGAELMAMSDAQFKFAEQTIDSLPISNTAALKEGHIPETEKGIIGNTKEGVEDPKAQVKTEDIDPSVKSDARIAAKTASTFVPQMQSAGGSAKDISKSFNTTANRLSRLGISTGKLRLPTYKQF